MDGARRVGTVDATGIEVRGVFAGISAKNPWPELEWVGDTLNYRGHPINTPPIATPLHDEWSGDWVDIAIPAGWKPIAGAATTMRQPEFRYVWVSIESGEMVFAVATNMYIMAWGGSFAGWDGRRTTPLRADLFKRASAIRFEHDAAPSCYVAVMGRRQELVFFEQMTELPVAKLISVADQVTADHPETAHAPSEVLDGACAFAKGRPLGQRSGKHCQAPVSMVLSSVKATIDTDSGSWAETIADGPDDALSVPPHLLRSAVEIASTVEFRYRRPNIGSPSFMYLLFTGDETNVLTMAFRAS